MKDFRNFQQMELGWRYERRKFLLSYFYRKGCNIWQLCWHATTLRSFNYPAGGQTATTKHWFKFEIISSYWFLLKKKLWVLHRYFEIFHQFQVIGKLILFSFRSRWNSNLPSTKFSYFGVGSKLLLFHLFFESLRRVIFRFENSWLLQKKLRHLQTATV